MSETVKLSPRNELLPSTHNLPQQRNVNFAGRESDLTELRAALDGADSSSRVRVIHGMAGVGKTSLALEYAYAYGNEYSLIWWVRADTTAAIAASFAALAPKIGVLGAIVEEDLPEVCESVRRELEKRDRWLLIFDNAVGPDDVELYLPEGRQGHVIITSRSPNWKNLARPLPLRPWDRLDAITYLRMRSGRAGNDLDAARICQALGNLPLALEQAAALIQRTGLTFAAYLSRFETQWNDLFRQGRAGRDGDVVSVVAMAWELSMRHLAETNPQAIELITFCAFLNPDGIDRHFLYQCADVLPERLGQLVRSAPGIEEAIAALGNYSLVETNGLSISLHRLVAAQGRRRLDETAKAQWAEIAVQAAAAAFPFDPQETGSWQPSSLALAHAISATSHAEKLRPASNATIGLMDSIGQYLICRGQFDEAKNILVKALDAATRTYEPGNARISMVSNNLGRAHQKLGELDEARQLFERSLSIDKEVYGEGDVRTAAVANNFGVCLQSAGDSESARQHFEYALAVYEDKFGADHLKVAPVINNLAYVMKSQGEFDQSIAQFHRALEIAEAGHGPNHPTVACILANLGVAQRAKGNTEQARLSLERAARIDELVHGSDHPDVARDLGHLGKVFQDAGNFPQAKAKLLRALEIDESAFGKLHSEVIGRWQDLGRLHKAMNEVEEAIRCFERAADIARISGEGKKPRDGGRPDDFRELKAD